MSERENERVVRMAFDALSAGDQSKLLDLFAEDGRTVTMGNTLVSGVYEKAAMVGAAGRTSDFYKDFPKGIRFVIHTLTAQDDRVAAEVESFGDHSSGKLYNNKYHFLFRLRNGLITELKEYCDTEHVTDVICGGVRRGQA
jgi:ketosteroid isomerase-like protein